MAALFAEKIAWKDGLKNKISILIFIIYFKSSNVKSRESNHLLNETLEANIIANQLS